jgi:hypothetical protein
MRRLLLTTSLLATTALAPAAAMAGSNDVHLKGSPVLHRVDAKTVQVKFHTDKALPRRADGKILASVKVHGGVSSIGASGYGKTSYVSFTKLHAKRGSKFTVVIRIDGQGSIARNVTLR